jgi:peptide-methionine (S)-S-oxide reductase
LVNPVVTEVLAAPTFWPAEEYHQNFHAKNPIRYRYYRYGCGREKPLGGSRPVTVRS